MNENYKIDDWTDDTDQMILILDSLVKNNGNVDVIDFAQATCLFFLSVLGVDRIANGLAPDKSNVVVAAKRVPFSAANSKPFLKALLL
jgi:hypothetical protein